MMVRASCLAMVVFVGCSGGGDDPGATGSHGGDEGGVDDEGGPSPYGDTGGDPTGGTGGEEPGGFSCRSAAREPSDPRVQFDVDVACDHTMFARYGVATAIADDAVFVATAGFEESWVFRVDATSATPVADAPRLTQQRLFAAVDGDDGLLVAGLADDGRLALARYGETWTTDAIAIPGGTEELVDVDAAADDTPRAWLRDGENRWRVIGRGDAGWNVDPAAMPAGAVTPRFAIATTGDDVAATHLYDLDADAWRLGVRVGGAEEVLLGDATVEQPSACIPVRGDATVGLAPFTVLSARADALVIDSPTTPTTSLSIADSHALDSTCDAHNGAECLPDCHDVGDGRLDDAIAAARTDDGSVWVAWVHARIDRDLTYVESCDENKGSCWCDEEIEDDASSYTVRVVAVRPDGTVEPALEIPLADDPCGDQILAPGDALDLHAHGSRLAIVVRTAESDVLPGADFTLRTIAFDATRTNVPRLSSPDDSSDGG
jgi:hypothetical protein